MQMFRIKIVVVTLFAFVAGATLIYPRASAGQGALSISAITTRWRPRREIAGARFAGAKSCAECHAEESKQQHLTAMGRALQLSSDNSVLRQHPRLTFKNGSYAYEIVTENGRTLYTVTDGKRKLSVPVTYAFGQGKAGQTYVFELNGKLHESRVSYYRDTNNLDHTIGYTPAAPPTLEEALGRQISDNEAMNCFSCHATAAVSGGRLQLDTATPGVSCEACHGPGGDHIIKMKAGEFDDKRIFNPSNLGADELSQEYCGSCHRSVEEITQMPNHGGINNVRFQPYRLFTSRGHNPDDPRMSCTACHNPHEHLATEPSYYDAKCFACHLNKAEAKIVVRAQTPSADRTAKPCPVETKNCASCHMPEIELPGSHFKFTDHRIRVVKKGEAFPN